MSVHVTLMAVRDIVTISLEATTAHVKLDIKLLLTLTLVLVSKLPIMYYASLRQLKYNKLICSFCT